MREKIKEKIKKYTRKIGKAGYNKSFMLHKYLFCRSARQQNCNRYTKFNNRFN